MRRKNPFYIQKCLKAFLDGIGRLLDFAICDLNDAVRGIFRRTNALSLSTHPLLVSVFLL